MREFRCREVCRLGFQGGTVTSKRAKKKAKVTGGPNPGMSRMTTYMVGAEGPIFILSSGAEQAGLEGDRFGRGMRLINT